MKSTTFISRSFRFLIVIAILFFLLSCIINNPKPEDCVIVDVKIVKITKGSGHDIIFYDSGRDLYYINRGLERGLNLDSLNTKVLNKTVTLYLAKVLGGITSEHISQMTLGNEIIFTEFD